MSQDANLVVNNTPATVKPALAKANSGGLMLITEKPVPAAKTASASTNVHPPRNSHNVVYIDQDLACLTRIRQIHFAAESFVGLLVAKRRGHRVLCWAPAAHCYAPQSRSARSCP